MNAEPAVQPITFKSKPKYFSNGKGWKNYVNDQRLGALKGIGKFAEKKLIRMIKFLIDENTFNEL